VEGWHRLMAPRVDGAEGYLPVHHHRERCLFACVHTASSSSRTDHARAAHGKMTNVGPETVTRLELMG